MTINSKKELLDWCKAFKEVNKGNLLIPSLFDALEKHINAIPETNVDAHPEDGYFFEIIDLMKFIGQQENIKTPANKDPIGQVCQQFDKPSGLGQIAKDINDEIKKGNKLSVSKNKEKYKENLIDLKPKQHPLLTKLKNVSDKLKDVGVNYGIYNEKKEIQVAINQLEKCLSAGISNIPIHEVNKVINNAEAHLCYVEYIKNIENKVSDLKSHNKTYPESSASLNSDITAMDDSITRFKKEPLKNKIQQVKSFNDNIVGNLNSLDNKMTGHVHRETMKPLIKHALAACTIVGLPGVIMSLAHRAATGKFMFFEPKQKQLTDIHESLKSADTIAPKKP